MRYLLVLLLVLLCLPFALTGDVGDSLVGQDEVELPAWSWQAWSSGSFQAGVGEWLRLKFGGRNHFVRGNNLKNYALFGEITARDVVQGKNGYLFEGSYLETVTGRNARPAEEFDRLGEELSIVRDSLAANGVEFLVVMAPGKGTYLAEHRPEPYTNLPLNPANERSLLRILRKRDIPHINMNRWFREMKDTVSYPLFPQVGIHWTLYGQLLAMDSLIAYTENILEIDMPEIGIDSIEVSHEQRGIAADIWDGMNLPLPAKGYPLGYPHWRVGNPEKPQPRVLFVGDSFYFNLYLHHKFSKRFFGNGDMYYYFNELLRDGWGQGNMNDVWLPEDLLKYDMVVVMETESHYHRLGNGFLAATAESFIDRALGEVPEFNIQGTMREIRGYPEWMADLAVQAESQDRPLDSLVREAAIYILRQERKQRAAGR